jgi:carbon storage regulator
MLVLTRKYQERIRIGNNITITVLRMKGKAVRLGIEAPSNVPVIRGELAFTDGGTTVEVELPSDESSDKEAVAAPGRTFGRAAGSSAQWHTESRPGSSSSAIARTSEPAVGFGRMSREKAAKLMPKLASGTAPLRAIMEQR